MTWAIYTTPEDKDAIISGFSEAGLTNQEVNRVRPYAQAFVAGWDANIPVPPEHPCWITDAATMRVIVMTVGTKAAWLDLMVDLLKKGNREQIRFFESFIRNSPWYAVEWVNDQPPPASFWQGMTCT